MLPHVLDAQKRVPPFCSGGTAGKCFRSCWPQTHSRRTPAGMPATASKDARAPLSHLYSMRFGSAMPCPHLCLGRDSARPSSDFVAAAGRSSGAPRLISNRPARVAWPRPGQICPSSDYLDRVDARALCESPFPRPPRPPIRSSPDQRT
jgi:hypothetical protein